MFIGKHVLEFHQKVAQLVFLGLGLFTAAWLWVVIVFHTELKKDAWVGDSHRVESRFLCVAHLAPFGKLLTNMTSIELPGCLELKRSFNHYVWLFLFDFMNNRHHLCFFTSIRTTMLQLLIRNCDFTGTMICIDYFTTLRGTLVSF